MRLIVYSKSRSFEKHLSSVLEGEFIFRNKLSDPVPGHEDIYLVHASSFIKDFPLWLEQVVNKNIVIGVADENPQLAGLLTYTKTGVKAYFNAYMSAPHYEQMLRLLANGQSWFPPALLSETFELARSVLRPVVSENPLEKLTHREKEVCLAVAKGKSNKVIASDCNITERTVKAHLTHIFKKLKVKDRLELVVLLNQF